MPTLKIQNFKCYQKSLIPFGNLTVLVGANGAGKSSIIQSLLLLHEGILAPSGHAIPLNNFKSQNLGRAADIIYNNDTSLDIILTWNVEKPASSSRLVLSMPESESMLDIDVKRRTIGNNELSNAEFHFLSADRIGSTVAQPMTASDYVNVGDKGQFCAQLLANKFEYKVCSSRLYKENTSPFLLDQVNLYIKDIFPGVEIDARSSWEMQTAQIMIRNSVQKQFGLSTNVGYGISYLLPILATGLIASSNSILIVENPEAHLHPSAQSQVGKFLAMVASTGTRVIVETHSDHLINGIQFYAVSHPDFLDKVIINNFSIDNASKNNRGKIKIECIKLERNGDYSCWPDGFMDQSKNDLYDLYKVRRLLNNKGL